MDKIDQTKLSKDVKDLHEIKDNTFFRELSPSEEKHKIELEVGDSKQPDTFFPQVKFKHWDNEVNFSARLVDDSPDVPTVGAEGEKILWKKGNREARLYETTFSQFEYEKNLNLGFLKESESDNSKIEYAEIPHPVILMDGDIIASDNNIERPLRQQAAQEAFGSVLIVGLGLGVINEYLKLNKKVSSITVVEINQKVIDLVTKKYPKRFKNVKFIKQDFFEYVKTTTDKYDYIYGDIFYFGGAAYLSKWEKFLEVGKNILNVDGVIDGRGKSLHEDNKPENYQESGYEFEITLKEQPATNKIDFSIQTKGLSFIYQPPLTECETAKPGETITETAIISKAGQLLAFRADNVVRSYAVYYQDHPSNIEGKNIYQIGKVGHIYRPKIFDATGKWVWGELSIDVDAGILSVIIPQEFLNTAVYPIRHAAGATFGTTVRGSSSQNNANVICALPATSPSDAGSASASKMSVGIGSIGSGNLAKMNVYTSGNAPITNGQTEEKGSAAVTGGAYNDFNFTVAPTLAASTVYRLCYWPNANGKLTMSINYDTGASGVGQDDSETYGTWPNPLVPVDNTRNYSIYVTYTPGVAVTNFFMLFFRP